MTSATLVASLNVRQFPCKAYRPRYFVLRMRSNGALISFAYTYSSSSSIVWSCRMAPITARQCRTASTTFPVPASPWRNSSVHCHTGPPDSRKGARVCNMRSSDLTRPPSAHLGSDHGRSLSNAPEGLAQVSAPAYKGHLEVVLVDVVVVIGRGQDLSQSMAQSMQCLAWMASTQEFQGTPSNVVTEEKFAIQANRASTL
jgi:hypothetical protein